MFFKYGETEGDRTSIFDYDGLVYKFQISCWETFKRLYYYYYLFFLKKVFEVFKEPPRHPGLEGPESLRKENFGGLNTSFLLKAFSYL